MSSESINAFECELAIVQFARERPGILMREEMLAKNVCTAKSRTTLMAAMRFDFRMASNVSLDVAL